MSQTRLLYEENKNQWPAQVDFKTDLPSGRCFLEPGAFTYVLYNPDDLNHHHGEDLYGPFDADPAVMENNRPIRTHAFRQRFTGSNPLSRSHGENRQDFHLNYFIGKNAEGWASDVSVYEKVVYSDLYDGIDLIAGSLEGNLKYEFYIHIGADPDQILMTYEGLDAVSLDQGDLIIQTSVGKYRELHPLAYQLIGGRTVEVECSFRISEGMVGFDFPNGYDKGSLLVIDPTLIAATYSGSTATTYGHSATYGPNGHIYSGGRCFGIGYPVTLGAFQTSFGGNVDIAISKLSPTGTNLLWATYIGGSSADYVHSMIVDKYDRLFVYGSSNSSNYPTTTGCYDNSSNGGYDIIVSKLSATGNALIGSTYVGGSSDEAQNGIPKNYGDTYRGEIVLDNSNNPYVASFSFSTNFPVTAGVHDNTHNGGQDGVIFHLDSNLTQLKWSTFLGGTGNDAAYGIKLDPYNNIVVVGGTQSSNFPVSTSAQTPTFQGQTDGFVTFLLVNAAVIINSSFFGTSSFDQIYFVELDSNNNVYVYGISDGLIPVIPAAGTYNNPNGHLFVAKFNPYLTSTIFSTRLGSLTATSQYSFSPTAFLVDVCENIYLAGWGSTTGYPISPGAMMATTDGSDFYLMVLDKNATGLMYGTYFGDNTSTWDHVDGGTSRFDKNGVVYHGVCAGGQGIPTTPGAYASTKLASWDIAVFKIDFQMVSPVALASASPNSVLCVSDVFSFVNSSINFSTVSWDFGDGSPPSTLQNPTHQYSSPGTYQVRLVVYDSTKCIISDTAFLSVTAMPIPVVDLGPDSSLCIGDFLVLDAGPGHLTHIWSTGDTTQAITVNTGGSYWVTVGNGPCFGSDTIALVFNALPVVALGNDSAICEGGQVMLDAGFPGSGYTWSTGASTQTILADSTGQYWVQIVDANGCKGSDTFNLLVKPVPSPDLGPDTTLCEGQSITLDAGYPGASYLWNNGGNTQQIAVQTAGTFGVIVDLDGCLGADSIMIGLIPDFSLGPDKSLCDYGEITLDAGTGDSWVWSDGQSQQSITVSTAGTYWVIKQVNHCSFSDSILITGEIAPTLYFPNSFTPNGDGLNDLFTGKGKGLSSYSLEIFNRFGQLIYYSSDLSQGWDGRFNGQPVPEGVYVWVSQMTTLCDPEVPVRLQGTLQLLR